MMKNMLFQSLWWTQMATKEHFHGSLSCVLNTYTGRRLHCHCKEAFFIRPIIINFIYHEAHYIRYSIYQIISGFSLTLKNNIMMKGFCRHVYIMNVTLETYSLMPMSINLICTNENWGGVVEEKYQKEIMQKAYSGFIHVGNENL